MLRIVISFLTMFFILISSGCSKKSALIEGDNISKADLLFERGKAYFNEEKWSKSVSSFTEYAYSYPYHEAIAEGTFLLAESYYNDGQFDLASMEYRRVSQRFEESEYAERAEIMIGEAFLASSPRTDLNQDKTRAALEYFKDFIIFHPSSEYLEQAQDGIQRCREKLAKKEYDIAITYFKLKKWETVILYADLIEEEYNGTSLIPKTLLLKAKVYLELPGEEAKGISILTDLATYDGDTEIAQKASKLLRKTDN
ncbi:outer membrane protein assembly factor BamD [bacterium]|nr:outer membrane protein assembly factor BamD [bacterium]